MGRLIMDGESSKQNTRLTIPKSQCEIHNCLFF